MRKYLSEVMTLEDKETILNDNSKLVLLTAGTGAGKSFYLCNELVYNLISDNKKVLILCNRSALASQLKSDLGIMEFEKLAYKKKGFIKGIGDYEVATYQSLDKRSLEYLVQYDYIICDEAHYILNDSTFNSTVDKCFDMIREFKNLGKQVLMITATEFELIPFLNFNDFRIDNNNFVIMDYNKEINWYDRITLHCTSKKVIDIASIQTSKTAIFVKGSKKNMPNLCDKLDDSMYIHSKHKKDKDGKYIGVDADMQEKMDKLLLTQTFDTKYLVTNATLDNGVNFKDDGLKTIIIDNIYDLVSTIQITGRKRFDVANKDDKLDVYILSNFTRIKKEADTINYHMEAFDNYYFKLLLTEEEKKLPIEQQEELNNKKLWLKYRDDIEDAIEKSRPFVLYHSIDDDMKLTIKPRFALASKLQAQRIYLGGLTTKEAFVINGDSGASYIDANNINYRIAYNMSKRYNKPLSTFNIDKGFALKTLDYEKKIEVLQEQTMDNLKPFLEANIGNLFLEEIQLEEFNRGKHRAIGKFTLRKPLHTLMLKKGKKLTIGNINKVIESYGYYIESKMYKVNRKIYKVWKLNNK